MSPDSFSLAAGDTFLTISNTIRDHLWVVVSDPSQDDEEIVIVSFTTHHPGKDESCLIQVGDHPFIKHETVVSYENTKTPSLTNLASLHEHNQICLLQPVSDSLLDRIRGGLMRSPYTPRKTKRKLREQGLAEEKP